LLQAVNSTQHLRVARNELFPPGPRAKIVQIKLFGPSRQVVQLIDKDFSFSSLVDLASFTRLRDSVVAFCGIDGFFTDTVSLLSFLKRCNPDCTFVWIVKGDVVDNDKVSNLIHRLEIYLNQPQFRTGDHLDTFFGRLETLSSLKDEWQRAHAEMQLTHYRSNHAMSGLRIIQPRKATLPAADWRGLEDCHGNFAYDIDFSCRFCGDFFACERYLECYVAAKVCCGNPAHKHSVHWERTCLNCQRKFTSEEIIDGTYTTT
jgi:hypothetical protein